MKSMLTAILSSKNGFRLMAMAAVLSVASAMTAFSVTPSQATVTVVNNSSLEIRHLYLSPVDNDNWGPDQLLDDSVVAPGQSFNLSVSSDQSQVKVVSEDQNGCFLYQTVATSGNSVWTITSDAVPNCGG